MRAWLERTLASLREPVDAEDGPMRSFRIGSGRLSFRGEAPDVSMPYLLCLGGGETRGKAAICPWPELVGQELGMQCANLGYPNAGLDLVIRDEQRFGLCRHAEATVVQITGAHLLSNRFYRVHPWRNDRFLDASAALRRLYGEVDFTEFSFVRELLQRLHALDAQRFRVVVDELVTAWLARMRMLKAEAKGPVIALWFAGRPPPADPARLSPPREAGLPLFVDQARLDLLADEGWVVVETLRRAGPKSGFSQASQADQQRAADLVVRALKASRTG